MTEPIDNFRRPIETAALFLRNQPPLAETGRDEIARALSGLPMGQIPEGVSEIAAGIFDIFLRATAQLDMIRSAVTPEMATDLAEEIARIQAELRAKMARADKTATTESEAPPTLCLYTNILGRAQHIESTDNDALDSLVQAASKEIDALSSREHLDTGDSSAIQPGQKGAAIVVEIEKFEDNLEIDPYKEASVEAKEKALLLFLKKCVTSVNGKLREFPRKDEGEYRGMEQKVSAILVTIQNAINGRMEPPIARNFLQACQRHGTRDLPTFLGFTEYLIRGEINRQEVVSDWPQVLIYTDAQQRLLAQLDKYYGGVFPELRLRNFGDEEISYMWGAIQDIFENQGGKDSIAAARKYFLSWAAMAKGSIEESQMLMSSIDVANKMTRFLDDKIPEDNSQERDEIDGILIRIRNGEVGVDALLRVIRPFLDTWVATWFSDVNFFQPELQEEYQKYCTNAVSRFRLARLAEVHKNFLRFIPIFTALSDHGFGTQAIPFHMKLGRDLKPGQEGPLARSVTLEEVQNLVSSQAPVPEGAELSDEALECVRELLDAIHDLDVDEFQTVLAKIRNLAQGGNLVAVSGVKKPAEKVVTAEHARRVNELNRAILAAVQAGMRGIQITSLDSRDILDQEALHLETFVRLSGIFEPFPTEENPIGVRLTLTAQGVDEKAWKKGQILTEKRFPFDRYYDSSAAQSFPVDSSEGRKLVSTLMEEIESEYRVQDTLAHMIARVMPILERPFSGPVTLPKQAPSEIPEETWREGNEDKLREFIKGELQNFLELFSEGSSERRQLEEAILEYLSSKRATTLQITPQQWAQAVNLLFVQGFGDWIHARTGDTGERTFHSGPVIFEPEGGFQVRSERASFNPLVDLRKWFGLHLRSESPRRVRLGDERTVEVSGIMKETTEGGACLSIFVGDAPREDITLSPEELAGLDSADAVEKRMEAIISELVDRHASTSRNDVHEAREDQPDIATAIEGWAGENSQHGIDIILESRGADPWVIVSYNQEAREVHRLEILHDSVATTREALLLLDAELSRFRGEGEEVTAEEAAPPPPPPSVAEQPREQLQPPAEVLRDVTRWVTEHTPESSDNEASFVIQLDKSASPPAVVFRRAPAEKDLTRVVGERGLMPDIPGPRDEEHAKAKARKYLTEHSRIAKLEEIMRIPIAASTIEEARTSLDETFVFLTQIVPIANRLESDTEFEFNSVTSGRTGLEYRLRQTIRGHVIWCSFFRLGEEIRARIDIPHLTSDGRESQESASRLILFEQDDPVSSITFELRAMLLEEEIVEPAPGDEFRVDRTLFGVPTAGVERRAPEEGS